MFFLYKLFFIWITKKISKGFVASSSSSVNQRSLDRIKKIGDYLYRFNLSLENSYQIISTVSSNLRLSEEKLIIDKLDKKTLDKSNVYSEERKISLVEKKENNCADSEFF